VLLQFWRQRLVDLPESIPATLSFVCVVLRDKGVPVGFHCGGSRRAENLRNDPKNGDNAGKKAETPKIASRLCHGRKSPLCQHHDALAFPDGSTVLINSLVQGQRVRVLQLPVGGNELQSAKIARHEKLVLPLLP
jgi:hypothetical protein